MDDSDLALDAPGEVAGVGSPVEEQPRGAREAVGHDAQGTASQTPEVLVALFRVRVEALTLAAEVWREMRAVELDLGNGGGDRKGSVGEAKMSLEMERACDDAFRRCTAA